MCGEPNHVKHTTNDVFEMNDYDIGERRMIIKWFKWMIVTNYGHFMIRQTNSLMVAALIEYNIFKIWENEYIIIFATMFMKMVKSTNNEK